MNDEGTPLQRLCTAVDELSRAEKQHSEKRTALESAQKQVELKATEEAHAARLVEAARAAVNKAARELKP